MAAVKPSRTTIKNALDAAVAAGFGKVSLQITLEGTIIFEFVGDGGAPDAPVDAVVEGEQGLDWEDYE